MIIKHPNELFLLVGLEDGLEKLKRIPMMKPGASTNLLIPGVAKIERPTLTIPLAFKTCSRIICIVPCNVQVLHKQSVEAVVPRHAADTQA